MDEFKVIEDLTSDVMFEAYGKDLREVFINSAKALFSVICNSDLISTRESVEVVVEGEDEKDLLHNWLQHLIAVVDTDEVFLKSFDITEISKNSLRAVCKGESITKEKGETVVKAISYYKFSLEKKDSKYISRFSCDI